MSGTNLLSQKYIGIDTKKEKKCIYFPPVDALIFIKKNTPS